MSEVSVQKIIVERELRSRDLYQIFRYIFITTSILAALSLIAAFAVPEYFASHPHIETFTKMLFATVIAEVAAAVFALSRDLFGTKTLEEVKELQSQAATRNSIVSFLMDQISLISSGDIDVEEIDINLLRAQIAEIEAEA